MSAITSQGRAAPVITSKGVAGSLALLRQTYLEPIKALPELLEANRSWLDRSTYLSDKTIWDLRPNRHIPFGQTEAEPEDAPAQRLRDWLDRGPPPAVVEATAKITRDLLGEAPNKTKNRMLLSVMIDSFPNARPHSPEVYFEVLADQILEEGFPPVAVAAGCNQIVRSQTFLPPTAEVITIIAKENSKLQGHLYRVRKVEDARFHVTSLLAEYDGGARPWENRG